MVPLMPKVSVLLPAFNAAATIGRAIATIRHQSFADWELLAIDDGSVDGTAALLTEAAAKDDRIRVLRRPHEGLVSALNAGLGAARGGYIARMDADDEAHPERLKEQSTLLDARPGIGLASCLVEFGGDRTANEGYALHVEWINSLLTPEAIALNRFIESPLAHPSVMFRRELVDRHGGYCDSEFPEDYELWLRWLDAGVAMAKVPRPLLRWNDLPSRLSRTDPRYSPEAFFRTKAKWLARELARRREVGDSRAVWIWGAGRPTRKRAAYLEAHGVRIVGYIDVDPKKTTPALGGRRQPVIPPTALPSPAAAIILAYIASRGARDLIRATLLASSRQEGADFLLCA